MNQATKAGLQGELGLHNTLQQQRFGNEFYVIFKIQFVWNSKTNTSQNPWFAC